MEKSKNLNLLTAGEAGDELGVSRMTALTYAKDGLFPHAFKLPGGDWRIPIKDVLELKRKGRARTPVGEISNG